jgi:hypothetical protein
VGTGALFVNTTGANNVAIGHLALDANTTASNSTAVGHNALTANTTGASNTAVGISALKANTTGASNVAVGSAALEANTTGNSNTAFGASLGGTHGGTLQSNTTGYQNTAFGNGALYNNTEGFTNTAVGFLAMYDVTTGDNNIGLGLNAGRSGSPGGAITTANNTINLGNGSIATANIQVDWTVASDQRDKTDFTDLDLGLDFVKALAPVTYKWDKRSKYGDNTAEGYDLNAQIPDGTHKEDWLDIGFKAQEVQALEEASGYTTEAKKNLTVSTSPDGKQMGIQYSKFVPILVKAIQELSKELDELKQWKKDYTSD